MTEYSTSIDIEAPPEVVFAHLVTAEGRFPTKYLDPLCCLAAPRQPTRPLTGQVRLWKNGIRSESWDQGESLG
jgi:hypothetical protein